MSHRIDEGYYVDCRCQADAFGQSVTKLVQAMTLHAGEAKLRIIGDAARVHDRSPRLVIQSDFNPHFFAEVVQDARGVFKVQKIEERESFGSIDAPPIDCEFPGCHGKASDRDAIGRKVCAKHTADGLRACVCYRCGDTHRMFHSGLDRIVPCTSCPVPCQDCRLNGRGAFCADTPCDCPCHQSKTQENQTKTLEKQTEGPENRPLPVCDVCDAPATDRVEEAPGFWIRRCDAHKPKG